MFSIFTRERLVDNSSSKGKSVKFKDGINPGDGTSSSGGEDMHSPPPPSSEKEKVPPKKKKKSSSSKKRKQKLKSSGLGDDCIDGETPPPKPSTPYPFCPPGILYQVCPQYAGE